MTHQAKFRVYHDQFQFQPEIIEFTAHIQRIVELIPGLSMPRSWERDANGVTCSLESENNAHLTVLFERIGHILAHTPYNSGAVR